MNLTYQTTCENIDWNRVVQLLREGGMAFSDPQTHQRSFEAAYTVLFVFEEDKLIGCGRILSDGCRQSAIYDVVVDSEYQGLGMERDIVIRLMDRTPGCNFILYASPGKEGFYETLGFKRMKTSMILFSDTNKMSDTNFVEI